MKRIRSNLYRIISFLTALVFAFSGLTIGSFVPVSAAEGDPVSIDLFSASFRTGGTKDGNVYVWKPTVSESDHYFIYRVDYNISGIDTLPVGSVVFHLPLHILKDR